MVVHEQTNARYLTAATIPDPVGALVCDASFIGLATLLPAPLALCAPERLGHRADQAAIRGGPVRVGSKGVVRDPAVHQAVCERVRAWWSALPGWRVLGRRPKARSPGPEGNREFLIAGTRAPS